MGRQSTLKDSEAIQSDVSKLEKCYVSKLEKSFVSNTVKFSKDKWQVLHLRRNNPKPQYMLGANKRLGRKGAGIPVDE